VDGLLDIRPRELPTPIASLQGSGPLAILSYFANMSGAVDCGHGLEKPTAKAFNTKVDQ
jgi:hypothetical protein